MPIKVTCNQCGGILHAPDDSAGKRGRCPTCGTVLTIAGESVGPAPSQFGAPPLPRPATPQPQAAPVSNPWGSLPSVPDDKPLGGPAGPPKSTYDIARDPPAPARQPEPAPSPRGSRVPPDPRRNAVSDPFAKPGKPPADDRAVTNRGWLKVRRGLGWIRTAVFFALLGVLAYAAVPILQTFDVKLPDQTPGFLKIDGYSQVEEIRLLGAVGPLALAMLCGLIGRFGVSAAPTASGAKGTAVFSSLATLVAVGGFGAFAAMTGLAMKDSGLIPQLTPGTGRAAAGATVYDQIEGYVKGVFMTPEETPGKIQGLGFVAFLAFGLLAEVWFVATLGRMGAALQSPRAAGRTNRFVILVGLLFAVKVFLLLAARVFFKDELHEHVWSKWAAVEEKWKVVGVYGGIAFAGLVLAFCYWRMIGGVRHAIRENVDPAG
jgi:hypothetical protein